MKKLIVLMLFVAMFLPSQAFGQDNRKRMYFPQIPIGDGWRIILNFMNVKDEVHQIGAATRLYNGEGITPPAKYLLENEDGRFSSRVLDSEGTPGSYGFQSLSNLGPYGQFVTSVSKTPDSPGLVVGWTELIQDNEKENIAASVTLQWWVDGVKISEAGVPAVEAKTENFVQIFLAEADTQQTGLAMANPNEKPVEVTLRLMSWGSIKEISKTVTLPVKGHFSRFVPELFPEFQGDSNWQKNKTFGGVLKVTSTLPVPVLALRTSVVPGVGFMISTLAAAAK